MYTWKALIVFTAYFKYFLLLQTETLYPLSKITNTHPPPTPGQPPGDL